MNKLLFFFLDKGLVTAVSSRPHNAVRSLPFSTIPVSSSLWVSAFVLALTFACFGASGALAQAACNQLNIANSILTASPASLPAGLTSTISVSLRNNGGNAASCAGVFVRFSTNFGTLSSTANVLTNGSGVASVTLTSPIAGSATVTGIITSSSSTGAPGIGNPATVVFTTANAAPTANAGPDQSVASAASVSLTGAGSSDPEGGALSYAWSQTGGTPVTLPGAGTVAPSFTAPTLAAGDPAAVLVFSLTVTDPLGASSAADTVTITVNAPANAAPTANAGPDQSVASAASVSLTGAGSSDPEGGALSYAWTQTGGTPVTLTGRRHRRAELHRPDARRRRSRRRPRLLAHRHRPLGGRSAADTVTITVNAPANAAPTANAGPDQSVASAASVSLTGAGSSDPEGGALSYAWSQTGGTPVTLAGAGTVAPSFTAPTLAAGDPAAVLVFSLTVTDPLGASSAADTVTITVNAPANAAPTANAGPDQSVASAASVSLTGAGSSDPEGGALSYAWTRPAARPSRSQGAGTVAPSFTAPTLAAGDPAAVLVFSLTVTDPLGASSAADTVTITVNAPANAAPTANAGPDQSVASAASVSLTGAGSSDPEGGALSYAWSQTGGTPVTLTGAGTVAPSFTAPTLAAVIPPPSSSSRSPSPTPSGPVPPPTPSPSPSMPRPMPPTANAGPDQSVASAASVSLTGAGSSDPEGGALAMPGARPAARPSRSQGPAPSRQASPPPPSPRAIPPPSSSSRSPSPTPSGPVPPPTPSPSPSMPRPMPPPPPMPDRPVRRLRRQRLADRCRLVRSRGRRAELCLDARPAARPSRSQGPAPSRQASPPPLSPRAIPPPSSSSRSPSPTPSGPVPPPTPSPSPSMPRPMPPPPPMPDPTSPSPPPPASR